MLDEATALPDDPDDLRSLAERLIAEVKAQAVLIEKLRTATHSAAQARAAKALEAAARGDSPDARRHLAAAESYAPDSAVVRRARAQLEDTLVAAYRATELVSEAEVLMEHEEVAGRVERAGLERASDPALYLGSSRAQVKRAIVWLEGK